MFEIVPKNPRMAIASRAGRKLLEKSAIGL